MPICSYATVKVNYATMDDALLYAHNKNDEGKNLAEALMKKANWRIGFG